ncbi:MAG: hypothetical protein ABDH37_02910 [Candidatus Hydrothermales bacterium]
MKVFGIKYRKKDFEFEVYGDREFVEKKFSELYKTFVEKRETYLAKEFIKLKKPLEGMFEIDSEKVKSFFKNYTAKNNTQRIILSAKFIYEVLQKKSFSLFDIRNIYKIMKWKISRNPSTFIQKFKRKKFLYVLPQKKGGRPIYALTESGLRFADQFKKVS